MEKVIYLPNWSIEQLDTCDDSSIWAKPIPYSETPTSLFSLSYTFDPEDEEDNEGINPIDEDYFYPDRTEPDMTIERLVEVGASEIKKSIQDEKKRIIEVKQSLVGKYSDAIYRCFLGIGDAECWARYDGEKIEVFSQHVYQFLGFGRVPPFIIKQEECLDKVLLEGAGLALNRKEVKLCDGSYDDKFSQKDPKFAYTKEDVVSVDGKTYKLFQDHDDGARGWALFTVKPKTKVRVLHEDHCGNVKDEMLRDNLDFLSDLGLNINFKFLDRYNHEFHESKYIPTPKDFKEDFNINEEGKKEKL